MATDDALVARALLTVLRATVSAVSEFPGHVMYLPSWRARTDEEMAQELALQPVPRRWIAVNWTGMLAIGCWDLEESENQRLRSPEVDGLRRTVSAETADRAPTIFIRGGSNFVVTDALRAGGADFVRARHEAGAVAMADGFARIAGVAGVASVHQGPGLTNCLTAFSQPAS